LETLMEIFPEAPVYTLMHDRERTGDRFYGRIAATSFLDFPLARRSHRWFIPLMPLAARSLNLKDKYDLIISDTAGFAKGVRYEAKSKHIAYIHTPLRYAWEQEEYLPGVISKWQMVIGKPILSYLKNWDYKAAKRPNVVIANSQFIGGKIHKYYGREASVIYPPVDTSKFYYDNDYDHGQSGVYFLAIGRLLHYKRFDLVIEAFAKSGLPLKIVGSGPEYKNLGSKIQNLKIRNIELLPFVKSEEELRTLYSRARALVFPQVEDFGLVAAEAQACGTPVIAYAAGGALEIVQAGRTGVFFSGQTAESLIDAVNRLDKLKLNRSNIAKAARKFSKEAFKKELLDLVGGLC